MGMEELRTFMAQDDVDGDELKEKTKALQELSWKATQSVYQQGDSGSADAGTRKTNTRKRRAKTRRRRSEELTESSDDISFWGCAPCQFLSHCFLSGLQRTRI